MLERGLTMPSAQSLLTLSVLYQVPPESFLDLIALERYRAPEPTAGVADAIEREVVDDLKASRHAEAYQKCLGLLARVDGGDPAGAPTQPAQPARVRVLCGIALWNLGWLGQAASIFRLVVDDLAVASPLRGWAYQNLVEVERARGCLASAHAFARDGLDLAREVGSERLQATFHATLANLKSDLAERAHEPAAFERLIGESLSHHADAQAAARRCGDDFLLAHAIINEGATVALTGDSARARQLLETGLDLARQRGYRRLVAYGWLELAKLHLAGGEPEAARDLLWRSEREASAAEASDLLFMNYFYLMKAAEAMGDESQHAFRKCLTLKSFQQGRFRELDEFEALQSRREAV
jgi:tetratricopeptide (TPR) repeat protein